MPGYTITQVCNELGISWFRLKKLLQALKIEPTISSDKHGACKIITAEQLERLRLALVETTLTTSPIAAQVQPGQTIEDRFSEIWRELHALRQMLEVSQVNFSSQGPFLPSTARQASKSAQPTQIGIGKARGAWLAVNHGANSPYAAKGWLCWNRETLDSDMTALMAIKAWMEDPRHSSGTWKPCGDAACPCATL